MSLRHHNPTARRSILLVAMVLLVLAQMLGQLHRVVHSPLSHAPTSAIATVAGKAASGGHAGPNAAEFSDHTHSPEDAAATWLERLFADHDRSGCEGDDRLTHDHVLWGEPAGLCMQAQSAPAPALAPARHFAAQAAGYLARGPPLQRLKPRPPLR